MAMKKESSMSYSGGRYVVTKIEGKIATVEGWNNPSDIRKITLPEKLPQGWPENLVGLQLLATIHRQQIQWQPAKQQIKSRFIPISSTYRDGGRITAAREVITNKPSVESLDPDAEDENLPF
jgi:hypothetical protein